MSRRPRHTASARHHVEWLQLIDISGPFLSLSVLLETFPQGLDSDDPKVVERLGQAFSEWQANEQLRRPDPAIHREFLRFVLREVLEYAGLLAEGAEIAELTATLPEHRVTLRPDLAVRNGSQGPALLVSTYKAGTPLERPLEQRGFHASPSERMRLLLRGTRVQLGLITNGAEWMLVHASAGRTSTFVTWQTQLLLEERITLRAFCCLLGARRFFAVSEPETLSGLFERSSDDEREVTDQLGRQVRRAVELLVSALDRADREASGELLREVSEDRLYEATVAVAIRIIFLLAAEARGLLPDDDPWVESYAVTPLRSQLQEVADRGGEELLERRFDAWPRLLATFRAVHGGVEHSRLRLPGYGGGLFDPARYPFLETADGRPLRISNRVILHMLDAIQTLEVDVPGGRERRPLSFRALGVEQIGHVYEGLLDHTAIRAHAPALGLVGTTKKEPELTLAELERKYAEGEDALIELLKEETGRSVRALRKALTAEHDPARSGPLRAACEGDEELMGRIAPFLGLVRDDAYGVPLVVGEGTVYVTVSPGRRATGTHYTPPSLTEPIVRHALEPIAYSGPADGLEPKEWRLKPPGELLELKVCDIAMGSAAFLVAACRYLAVRLVEAWEQHPEQMPPDAGSDAEERELTACRLVAERCLYGVDKNALAIEIAKVSMWLTTMRKDRPFTFVDHAFRHGDALLGVTSVEQLERLTLSPDNADSILLGSVQHAIRLTLTDVRTVREGIEASDAVDIREVDAKTAALTGADKRTAALRAVGDLIVGAALEETVGKGNAARALEAAAQDASEALISESDGRLARVEARACDALLVARAPGDPDPPRPFHWVLEFPEAFQRAHCGFDAIVGNPPFLGGVALARTFGEPFERLLKERVPESSGFVDLAAYFHRRAHELIHPQAVVALLGPQNLVNSANRKASTEAIVRHGRQLGWAHRKVKWPGAASLYVCAVVYVPASWSVRPVLDGQRVSAISPSLDAGIDVSGIRRLRPWVRYSQGTDLYGASFVKSTAEWEEFLRREPALATYLRPYVNADVLCSTPEARSDLLAVDFGERDKDELGDVPLAVAHLEEQVGRERSGQTRQIHETRPWLHWDKRLKAYEIARRTDLVLACPRVSKYLPMVMVDSSVLFGKSVKIFPGADYDVYGLLQSEMFLSWAFATSPLRGDGIEFSTRSSLDPCPPPVPPSVHLQHAGQQLWERRQSSMVGRAIGITELLNLVHDEKAGDDDIIGLRSCQVELDRTVAIAYGWDDLELDGSFWDTRQGARFTVRPDVRIELLARLVALNQERHAHEVRRGLQETGQSKRKRQPAAPANPAGARLFGND